MTSRIIFFDHFQRRLEETTDIPVTPRSYVINGYGKAEFSVPTTHPICKLSNLQFGNLVHIQHIPSTDGGGKLPDWTGIILPDRTWNKGVVSITCYGIESILAFRAMPYVQVNGTPRDIFTTILRYAQEKAKNIIIQPGVLDDIPSTFQDDLRTNAYDHILKMVKDSGMYFNIKGLLNPHTGNLELFANLYQDIGISTNFILNDTNTQLQEPILTETGTPSNQVFGYSQAQTAQSRIGPIERIHQESYDDYGPLQLNQIYIGRHDKNSVENATQVRAEQRGRPKKVPGKPSVLDINRSFDYLDLGNTATMTRSDAGFNPNGGIGFSISQVRITTIDYNDLTNKCPLNLEVLE